MKFSIHIFSSLLHRDFHSLHLRWYELPSWGGGGGAFYSIALTLLLEDMVSMFYCLIF